MDNIFLNLQNLTFEELVNLDKSLSKLECEQYDDNGETFFSTYEAMAISHISTAIAKEILKREPNFSFQD